MTYATNTALYADPALVEGVDYARRFRRHERFDDSLARTCEAAKTAVIAPHGGGIEPGTSELCLAVAGYHPAALPQVPPAGVTYDYWMFEGLRSRSVGNAELHVVSTGCDDDVAVSLCAGSLHALALHGFRPEPELPPDARVVLVGGADGSTPGNRTLKDYLLAGFENADLELEAIDATGRGELDGDSECNIVNRTLLGRGGQLELSTPLREAMFTEFTRSRRRHTTTPLFWSFVAVCRDALDRLEADRVVPPPCQPAQPTLTTS